MESALFEAFLGAANLPNFLTFCVLFGFVLWMAFKNRVIVPGEVAELREELAGVKAGHEACETRCKDLLARIVALETQLNTERG